MRRRIHVICHMRRRIHVICTPLPKGKGVRAPEERHRLKFAPDHGVSNTLATHQQHISNTSATHQPHLSFAPDHVPPPPRGRTEVHERWPVWSVEVQYEHVVVVGRQSVWSEDRGVRCLCV